MIPSRSARDRGKIFRFSLILTLLLTLLFFLVWDIPALLSRLSRLSLTDLTPKDLRGRASLGYTLGYTALLLMVIAQIHTLWRRAPWRIGKLGMGKGWLKIHCILLFLASILALLHSGLPYTFTQAPFYRYIHLDRGIKGLRGMAGLAAWLLLLTTMSGVLGIYLYGRLGSGGRRISKAYRHWRIFHTIISALLYGAAALHLILVVWFKYIPAV